MIIWIAVKLSSGAVVITRDPQVGNGIRFTDMSVGDHMGLKDFLAAAAERF